MNTSPSRTFQAYYKTYKKGSKLLITKQQTPLEMVLAQASYSASKNLLIELMKSLFDIYFFEYENVYRLSCYFFEILILPLVFIPSRRWAWRFPISLALNSRAATRMNRDLRSFLYVI